VEARNQRAPRHKVLFNPLIPHSDPCDPESSSLQDDSQSSWWSCPAGWPSMAGIF